MAPSTRGWQGWAGALVLDRLLDELHELSDAEKGHAFERVCRWYLESAPEYRAVIKRVWLWSEWPEKWGRDTGVDLIAETTTGDLWAIQAKAYSPNYTVKKADVDSFLSESNRPEIAHRLLIATTDRVGAAALRPGQPATTRSGPGVSDRGGRRQRAR